MVLPFKIKQTWLKYGVIALIFLFAYWVILRSIGGPLVTPDSMVYLDNSLHPWISRHGWHPPGLSTFLYGLQLLQTPFPLQTAMIASFFATLLFTFFHRVWGFKISLLLTCFILSYTLILQLSLWSETFFLALFYGTILILFSEQKTWMKYLLCIPFFTLMIKTRSAGFFLIPSLFFSFFIIKTSKKTWHRVLTSGASIFLGLLLGFLWTYPQQQTQMPCQQGLISMSDLPICENSEIQALCQLDSDHLLSTNDNSNSDNKLSKLHFDEKSPISQFKRIYPEENICHLYKKTLIFSLTQHPILLVKLMLQRLFQHFYQPQFSERGSPLLKTSSSPEKYIEIIDKIFNAVSWIFPWVLLIGLLALMVKTCFVRSLPSISLALLLAGLGHAMGLVINNPFHTLRYLALSQLLLFSGIFYALGHNQSKK